MSPERTNYFDRSDATERDTGYASAVLLDDCQQLTLPVRDQSVAGVMLPELEFVRQPLMGLEQTELTQLRTKLLQAAPDKHGLDAGQIRELMTDFEQRCRADGTAGLPSDRQILETYRNLTEILNVGRNDAIKRDRGRIFLATLYDIARPGHIAQGRSIDCGAAMLEVYVCVRHPEKYTSVLAQLSHSWGYRTESGVVALSPGARQVTQQEYDWSPSMGGSAVRNISSALFQRAVTASLPQFRGYDGHTYLGADGVRREFTGLWVEDIKPISRTITGTEMTIWRLGQGTMPDTDKMLDMKKEGNWPIGLIIPPTRHNPRSHALTILRTGTCADGRIGVYLKDNYGEGSDHGLIAYEDLRRTDLALKDTRNGY